MFGQLPLSQMVWSLCWSTKARTLAYSLPVGSLTLSQLGFETREVEPDSGEEMMVGGVDMPRTLLKFLGSPSVVEVETKHKWFLFVEGHHFQWNKKVISD